MTHHKHTSNIGSKSSNVIRSHKKHQTSSKIIEHRQTSRKLIKNQQALSNIINMFLKLFASRDNATIGD
jgi:hypothetical protein